MTATLLDEQSEGINKLT